LTGYLGKQLAYAAQRQVVTGKDCGATNSGLPGQGDDPDMIGMVLSKDIAGIPAGTPLTKQHLSLIGSKPIRVRSLTTCQMPHGVCQKCSGQREGGHFPEMGANVGITAARVVAEPWVQKLSLCLSPETEVRMADFSVKRLKDIQAGDQVLGSTLMEDPVPVTVLAVHHNGSREVYRFTYQTSDGSIFLDSTKEHKILSASRQGLSQLHPVESVGFAVLIKGSSSIVAERTDVRLIGNMETLDLEVDHPDHLFVLANGMIVSNSAKHVGGAVGTNDNTVQGIDGIIQFLNVPDRFVGGAVMAPEDGRVTQISKAPQGGNYVFVNDKQLWVSPDNKLLFKVGDTLEAGDALSDGLPNPAEVAKYKGLGEARRYFVDRFGQMLKDNGVQAHRRNLESISKALYDRVTITKPEGLLGYMPGETVPYSDLQREYKERAGTYAAKPKAAIGRYLERPVLHYTIGTRITPSVARALSDEGVQEVNVNDEGPDFEPEVMRMMDIPASDPDWKVRLSGFNLKKSLLDSATHGSVSNNNSTSYVPKLMNPSLL
jgi:hypothetical protein